MSLNLSSLGFIVFSFVGNHYSTHYVDIEKRQAENKIDQLAKNVLNFQITWTIVLFTDLHLAYWEYVLPASSVRRCFLCQYSEIRFIR